MAGNAVLDSSNLVDSLVPTIDELRQDLHAAFGVRAFRAFVVRRAWSGGTPGLGNYTETEVEVLPAPMVEPFVSFEYKLRPCGLTDAGYIRVREVSLTYTEADLGSVAPNEATQVLWRVQEGHGQATATRYFRLMQPPFPDREKNIGWQVGLQHVHTSAQETDLAHDPVTDTFIVPVTDSAGAAVWA